MRWERVAPCGYHRPLTGKDSSVTEKIRLDKWLWAARFYKTRSLAVDEIGRGRVLVNDQLAKPAREVGPGDRVRIRKEDPAMEVLVRAVSSVRGPAPQARLLYEETPQSQAARERAAEMRRLAPEPAQQIADGRPTKRDRRLIDAWRNKP
ncbi:RNA-binding S4 domain-containing protein [Bordetella trematum]|nr:RNA-binding S4 domain-containing protein [Bordetella trematum]NNH18395.1 RNA-binding S4 domain-containing protein [Bordetella trematum]QIM72563.1 RNA-binding S4 domain-containing protein [Bordetella trematum]